jgi:hypothetical protein
VHGFLRFDRLIDSRCSLTSFFGDNIIESMRVTLSLDDDVLREVKRYAGRRGLALGKAVSELVCRGLQAPLQISLVNGFPVVMLPQGSPTVTAEQVRKLWEETW